MQEKIVIIGAGSASFGPSTIVSLMQSRLLTGSTIALVDVDEEALGDMTLLANRLDGEWHCFVEL